MFIVKKKIAEIINGENISNNNEEIAKFSP